MEDSYAAAVARLEEGLANLRGNGADLGEELRYLRAESSTYRDGPWSSWRWLRGARMCLKPFSSFDALECSFV